MTTLNNYKLWLAVALVLAFLQNFSGYGDLLYIWGVGAFGRFAYLALTEPDESEDSYA